MIDSYAFGHVVVEGTSYEADVIVFPDRTRANWWRRKGHRLAVEDLESVLEFEPEVLVVGTGAYGGMEVPRSTSAALGARGIDLEVAKTAEACNRFNALLKEGKRAVAALHLTC